ncbi:MAG: hypothetical protein IEMM0002_0387 [bacterium]|nr:MAG: hypothetical protein IEMM0002_0387 [bacterium]
MKLKKLSPRDRKTVLFGALAAAVIFLYSLAVKPLWKNYHGFNAEIPRTAAMVKRYRAFIESAQERENQKLSLETEFNRMVSACFVANTEALATGQLAQLVRDKALAAGLTLKSSKPEKPESLDGFQILNLSVSFDSSLANLVRFMKEIQNNEKEILIRDARITSQKEQYPNDVEETLSVKLMITGLRFMPS